MPETLLTISLITLGWAIGFQLSTGHWLLASVGVAEATLVAYLLWMRTIR